MTTPTPTVKWLPRTEGGWYHSACGRFHIMYDPMGTIKRGRWTVWDNARTVEWTGGHDYYTTTTLTHAKSVAARWARQFPVG